ncbi:hypothetical protein L6R46_22920 [Myxococcota bacterium]|nr:hypothetical protein [Myxococcota bacterium]
MVNTGCRELVRSASGAATSAVRWTAAVAAIAAIAANVAGHGVMNDDGLANGGDVSHPRAKEGALLIKRPRREHRAQPCDVGVQLFVGEHDRRGLGEPGVEVRELGGEQVGCAFEIVDTIGDGGGLDGAQGERVNQPVELLALRA